MIRLTAEHLQAARACSEQVELFRQTFPGGAPLTMAARRKAARAGLDWRWTETLLSEEAWAAYEAAIAPAQAAYKAAIAPAWAAYEAATVPALLRALRQTLRDGPVCHG